MYSHQKTNRLINIFFVAIALAGLALITAQADQVVTTIRQGDWTALPGALLATALSYLCMSLSFALVGRLLGLDMGQRDMAVVGFVTNVINHVLTTGGLAGYSLRYLLMKRHGASFKDVIAVSVMHFYLTSLDMLVMIPVSVLYLMRNAQVARQVSILLGVLTALLTILAALAALLIFAQSWRQRLFLYVHQLANRILGRDLRDQMAQLDETLTRGVLAIRRAPGELVKVMGLTWLDWLGSVFVLSFCLDAFGPAVPFGVVVTGFVLGIMAGLISMVPGGLGVQEGSMTGVLALLGVPFSQAFLAAILFRAIFFFLPYLVSLVFSRWLLQTDQLLDATGAD
jgi:uncharacterized protein (TIRG00374 family)